MTAKVIMCVNQKGGVSKTRTIIETAYISGSIHNQKTCVIDLDAQHNTSDLITDDLSDKGAFDLLAFDKPIESLLKPAKEVFKNTLCLTADQRLSNIDPHLAPKLSRESLLKKGIQSIIDKFDLILIDINPTVTMLTVNGLVASSHYIIPSCISDQGKGGSIIIKALADEIIASGLNPNLKFLGVFLTLYQKGHSKSVLNMIEDFSNLYSNKLIDIRIPHSTKIIDANRSKIPITKMDPLNPVSVAYTNLTNTYFMEGPNV